MPSQTPTRAVSSKQALRTVSGLAMAPVATKLPDRLQHLSGALEVKFKTGAFATWSDVFVRLEGRWLTVHKRERDAQRVSAVELGRGVSVTDVLQNPEASAKFPRRFDLFCNGGLMSSTEISFRTKSRRDRDLWVVAIAANVRILSTVGLDPGYGVRDLEPVVARMRDAMPTHPLRIRSDLSVRCATGDAIVSFLVEQGIAPDRAQAALMCRRMVVMNMLHHVVWEKDFSDSHEPFVLNYELDDDDEAAADLDYEADHFQKYLDSRKFWKFLNGAEIASHQGSSYRAGGGAASSHGHGSNGSVDGSSTSSTRSNSRSALRSANSAEWPAGTYSSIQEPSHLTGLAPSGSSSSISASASAADTPSGFTYRHPRHLAQSGVNHSYSSSLSSAATPDSTIRTPSTVAPPPAAVSDNAQAVEQAKRAKKCSICAKSFNPLRRRHVCRVCVAPVCGNCSVSKRPGDSSAAGGGEDGQASTRMCISCKLSATNSSQEDFYDRIFAAPATNGSIASANGEARSSVHSHASSASTASNGTAASTLKRRPSSTNMAKPPPAPVAAPAARTSLTSSLSDGSAVSDCALCDNEVCAPLRDLREVPYPVSAVDAGGNTFYASANPQPEQERERVATVDSILRTAAATPGAARIMAQLCQMAAIAAQTPMAAVGLLTGDSIALTAHQGISLPAAASKSDDGVDLIPSTMSFAAHTCRNGAPVVCRDLARDVRFSCNPWRQAMSSASGSAAAFYVGIPLTLSTGYTVGAVEVWDVVPRAGQQACLDVVGQLHAVARALLKLLEEVAAAALQAQQEAEAEEQARRQQEQKEGGGGGGGADTEMEKRLLELLSQTTSTQEQLRTQQTHMVTAISSHSKQIGELAKQLERMEAALAAKLDQVVDESKQ